jgi:hypothetical protein
MNRPLCPVESGPPNPLKGCRSHPNLTLSCSQLQRLAASCSHLQFKKNILNQY